MSTFAHYRRQRCRSSYLVSCHPSINGHPIHAARASTGEEVELPRQRVVEYTRRISTEQDVHGRKRNNGLPRENRSRCSAAEICVWPRARACECRRRICRAAFCIQRDASLELEVSATDGGECRRYQSSISICTRATERTAFEQAPTNTRTRCTTAAHGSTSTVGQRRLVQVKRWTTVKKSRRSAARGRHWPLHVQYEFIRIVYRRRESGSILQTARIIVRSEVGSKGVARRY
jgi:hypothetical protein